MAATATLLCIHRDPTELTLLREKGYGLVTAPSGSEGLQLLKLRSVDAIVVEHHFGVVNGTLLADEIKHIQPQVPIVMVADDLELLDGSLKSVDAVVTRSDGAHFLWATLHFLLNVKPARHREATANTLDPDVSRALYDFGPVVRPAPVPRNSRSHRGMNS